MPWYAPIMPEQLELARDWLPRYTGMSLDQFGDHILLTNFRYHLEAFADRFGCDLLGDNKPMQAATNTQGLTIINFGIGSPNAATIMDLLIARQPRGVLFLGKCGGIVRLNRSRTAKNRPIQVNEIRGFGERFWRLKGSLPDLHFLGPKPQCFPASRAKGDLLDLVVARMPLGGPQRLQEGQATSHTTQKRHLADNRPQQSPHCRRRYSQRGR